MSLLQSKGRRGFGEKAMMMDVLQVMVLILCCASVKAGAALHCHCTDCDGSPEPGHVWATCQTEGACYTKVVMETELSSSPTVLRGCVEKEGVVSECGGDDSICCHSNRCNGRLVKGDLHLRKLLQSEPEMTSESMMSDEERTVAIITTSVCVVLITAIVALTVTFTICCLYFYRGNHRTHAAQADVEAGRVVIGNCCSAIIPQSETLSSLLLASHSPTDSTPSPSLSLLVQRAIVKNTSVEKVIERGKFCDVSLGHWRREKVVVKIYPPKHEKMWFSETQIYQVPHMHHPHLLTFIGADYLQSHGHLRHYLITEHHERGTLANYLREAVLDTGAVVVLAQSAASALAHLHLEVKGLSMEKPSIVHRNISSRSFYVKNDGTCCLGDMSLAVREGDNFQEEVKGKPLGHAPYLSPEVLENWFAQGGEGLSCDQLKKADVYALGLVIWEIARRCYIQGCIQTAETPFSSLLASETPTLEEMRQLVCSKHLRPVPAEHWNQDETMQSCVQTMTECWHARASNRPSAMSAKNSLDKLLPTIKLTSKSTKF